MEEKQGSKREGLKNVGEIVGIGIGVYCSQVLGMGWGAGLAIGFVLAGILGFVFRRLAK